VYAWLLALLVLAAGLACGAEPPRGREAVPAPTATSPARTEEKRFASPALGRIGREVEYTAHLPAGYDRGDRRYPVLYMLHGMGGSRGEWREIGLLDAVDRLVAAGEIAPLMVVLPQGDQGYWIDQFDGPAWATYVARDLVAEVDRSYRTVPTRAARAIGGLSMGAHGALQIGMNHADVFGVVGAHTPTLRDYAATREWLGERMGLAYFGDQAFFDARDPVHLYYAHADVAQSLELRLDVGSTDPWRGTVEWFHGRLDERGVAHEWKVLDGDGHHDPTFWTRHTEELLRFYDRALRAQL
jgi:S-formylglutathione hydrolase FrmB